MLDTVIDTAIIGGGLAGCHAAITLAQRDRRVILFEAEAYPRPKVCGEFLSPETVALFAESGFQKKLQALHPVALNTVRITAPDASQWSATLPAPGLGISRFALDKALADYALALGVDVQDGSRVIQIDGNLQEGFSLTIQSRQGIQVIHAKTVIATQGRHSNLDRVLKPERARQKPPHYVGLKQHFVGPALPGHLDLHVFPGGYCGMSQVEDGTTNVCLLVRQDVFQAAADQGRGGIAQFIEWMSKQNAHLHRWLAQAAPVYAQWLSTAHVSLMTKKPVEGDILFAGDSAGMIAPLAGDGMAMALHSGKLAAHSLDAYLNHRHDAQTMKANYFNAWTRTFSTRMRLGRGLQSLMLHPTLLAPGLRVLNRVPALGRWLIRHTRDLGLLDESP